MKESNKMKVMKVMSVINIAICCLVAGIGVFEKNALAASGWLAAALAYMQVNDLRRCCEDWKGLGIKTVGLFHAIFGNGDGQIVGIEVHRVDKDRMSEKKELPDFALDAANSFNECAGEFFHYIEDGNREFAISHGGISISVSIPESAPERKDADTPQA